VQAPLDKVRARAAWLDLRRSRCTARTGTGACMPARSEIGQTRAFFVGTRLAV
jgi:hypothetical protein